MSEDTEGKFHTCVCTVPVPFSPGLCDPECSKSKVKAEMRVPDLCGWEEVRGNPMPWRFIWHKCRHGEGNLARIEMSLWL